MMTVLEWMQATTRYNFEATSFNKIAIDREIGVDDDATTLTVEQKELLTADIIFTALVLSPSSTASLSISHNGFKKSTGGETENAQNMKLSFAKSIYKKYGDSKYDIINNVQKPIRLIPIEDEI